MRYLWALPFLGLLFGTAQAEVPADKAEAVNAEDTKTRLNSFGVPNEAITVIENQAPATEEKAEPQLVNNFPECNNADLLERVKAQIATFQAKKVPNNTYDMRSRIIIVKNIGNFAPIDLTQFTPSDNYSAANRMIDLKINQKMTDADFRLCVSTNEHNGQKIYLLIYPAQAGPMVEILNFDNTTEGRQELSFQY